MAARAGGKIAAPGKKLHCPVIDILISAYRVLNCGGTFGERGRIQNNEVVIKAYLGVSEDE